VKEYDPMKHARIWMVLLPLSIAALSACGGDDDDDDMGGEAGQSGEAGEPGRGGSTSGTGGRGGSSRGGSSTGGSSTGGSNTGGSAGESGSPGEGGMSGEGGSGGMGPRGKGNPPALGAQIDRMGRPAINTALNETFNADSDEKNAGKDAYNAASDPADWSDYASAFETSLGILDGLDATCGNQLLAGTGDTPYGALAGVLLDDQLYVNTDKGTCAAYLGVEAEALGLVEDGSCGGRTPSYDVIETSYSVLAAGVLSGVDDTISADDVTHDEDTFPFLAEPQ
jgi:hypothetical protein